MSDLSEKSWVLEQYSIYLGPLTNPGSPAMQLLGVYDEYLVEPLSTGACKPWSKAWNGSIWHG